MLSLTKRILRWPGFREASCTMTSLPLKLRKIYAKYKSSALFGTYCWSIDAVTRRTVREIERSWKSEEEDRHDWNRKLLNGKVPRGSGRFLWLLRARITILSESKRRDVCYANSEQEKMIFVFFFSFFPPFRPPPLRRFSPACRGKIWKGGEHERGRK